MKTDKLYEVIGDIREDYINDAHMTAKKSHPVWLKWGAMAACLCLVIVGALKLLPYENWTEHHTDDPNWSKTHFQTSDLNEIEAECGTDLLLDKIALPEEYHSEYILEITEEGDFKNPDLWSDLSVQISYGDSVIDGTADNIYCLISFDGDTHGINTSLWESDTTMELNGYAIQYSEKTTEQYAADGITLGSKLDYHGYAVFTHNGYTYYLSTNSDNPDFFDSVINQMLADSKPTE